MMIHGTRRNFLKMSATAAGIAPFSRVLGANDDIRLAVIGVGSSVKIGGKGKQEIKAFSKIPGVRIVALCDPERAHLDPEVQRLRDSGQKVEGYTDMRRLLESKDVDAVVVTTPNHWHALATIWSCQAGKDVYCQKPASHNIFEGRKMVEAAAKYNRIVASPHGPRGRSGIGEAFAYARQGKLGKMLYAHGLNYRPRTSIGKVSAPTPIPKTLDYDLWSGPAPILPVMREYLHYDWHWEWPYGDGDLGNMGIHYMDACRWALGQQTLPERVLAIGGRFGYDDDGETPNTQVAFLDYKPAPLIFEVRALPKSKEFLAQNWEKNSNTTMDSHQGVRVGVIVHCENGYIAQNKAFDNQGKLVEEFKPANESEEENFIKALRSRKSSDLQANMLDGHLSAALVHMINISHRIGRETPGGQIRETVRGQKDFAEACERFFAHLAANEIDMRKHLVTLGPWLKMEPKEERFVGAFSERANQLLTRDYRRPYVVPEKV
jgi:predicted dehydrogenase